MTIMTEANTKSILRKSMTTIRENISSRSEKEAMIWQRIVSSKEYKQCQDIFVYCSYKSEVDTISFFQTCIEDGKQIAVPRVETVTQTTKKPNNPMMNFYSIQSVKDLEKGAFGILEPKPHCKMATPTPNSIMLLPGLAFDKHGGRLGYGGGYYDYYLQHHNISGLIGLCFEEQIVEKVPIEKGDQFVTMIITDKEVYYGLDSNGKR